MAQFKFLIWGANGWIGSMLQKILLEDKHVVYIATSRLEDYISIKDELLRIRPDFVLNCAGITGNPTVDWCENNKHVTFLTNVVGTINLADACWRYGIHMTNYSTGCIYQYTEDKPIGSKFSEIDEPNFDGSTYSISKIKAEQLLSIYDNVLTLRIRMPVSDNLDSKNLVSKLIKYQKVVNIPNSITILPELLPISIRLTIERKIGIYNFTNPGAISHNEILSLYKKYIDPNFTWSNFTEDEQNLILKSRRSNCELDTTKLELCTPVTEIHEGLDLLFRKMQHSATITP